MIEFRPVAGGALSAVRGTRGITEEEFQERLLKIVGENQREAMSLGYVTLRGSLGHIWFLSLRGTVSNASILTKDRKKVAACACGHLEDIEPDFYLEDGSRRFYSNVIAQAMLIRHDESQFIDVANCGLPRPIMKLPYERWNWDETFAVNAEHYPPNDLLECNHRPDDNFGDKGFGSCSPCAMTIHHLGYMGVGSHDVPSFLVDIIREFG